jgi:hypothetical protein
MLRRAVIAALVALFVLPSIVAAQPYLGGAFHLVAQTHSSGFSDPLGGTTRGGSGVFGVRVSRRLAVEFEPAFGGPYSWTYSYRPGPSVTADVVARRRDSFVSFQLRTRVGVLEPVAGVSYVYGKISRRATIRGGAPYFSDSGSDGTVAVVGGLDAPLKLASRFYFVPTFRVFARLPHSADDPFHQQTLTGPFTFRYGVGVRVTF